jgi:predicted Zn-dependent peptidase
MQTPQEPTTCLENGNFPAPTRIKANAVPVKEVSKQEIWRLNQIHTESRVMSISETRMDSQSSTAVETLGTAYRKSLPNGLRILVEPLPHMRSASLGLFVDGGSRHERPNETGIAHFIEHMLFKGTKNSTSLELSTQQNLLGGNFNAYTGQEHIVLTAQVLDDHVLPATELLADMLLNSLFDPLEFERERGVILEELKMYDDTPDELILDMVLAGLYSGHSLGQPILGTPRSLKSFTPDSLRQYLLRQATPDRIVVAAAGAVDPDGFFKLVEQLFSNLPESPHSCPELLPPTVTHVPRILDRKLEQTHFAFGVEGPSRLDDRRFPYAVMSTILGAGAGSRIFQEVREQRGLAYSIGTLEWFFQDTGCLVISGGTSHETFPEVVEVVRQEVRKLAEQPPSPEEVLCAKAQLRTGVVLGLESSGGRMARLAEQELWFGRLISVDETLAKLEAVTPEAVSQSVQTWLIDRPFAASIIGHKPALPSFGSF